MKKTVVCMLIAAMTMGSMVTPVFADGEGVTSIANNSNIFAASNNPFLFAILIFSSYEDIYSIMKPILSFEFNIYSMLLIR